MDTAHWPQDIGLVKPMEELGASTTTTTTTNSMANSSSRASMSNMINSGGGPQVGERRVRPQKDQALNCPRCNSTNTKFCYYNNYSLTQPRYFCKTCRRYWTEGGSLRNVPVGGGSRKNKRSSSSSPSTTTTTTIPSSSTSIAAPPSSVKLSLPPIPLSSSQNPKLFHEGQDLKLAFPHPNLPEFTHEYPNLDTTNNTASSGTNPAASVSGSLSAMELLRGGIGGRGLPAFMQMPMPMPVPEPGAVYPPPPAAAFGLQDFRPPTLNFPLDGADGGGDGGYGGMQGVQESAAAAGRLLFPFEDLRQVPSSATAHEFDQNRGGQGGEPPGFWNQMMGGGGSW